MMLVVCNVVTRLWLHEMRKKKRVETESDSDDYSNLNAVGEPIDDGQPKAVSKAPREWSSSVMLHCQQSSSVMLHCQQSCRVWSRTHLPATLKVLPQTMQTMRAVLPRCTSAATRGHQRNANNGLGAKHRDALTGPHAVRSVSRNVTISQRQAGHHTSMAARLHVWLRSLPWLPFGVLAAVTGTDPLAA